MQITKYDPAFIPLASTLEQIENTLIYEYRDLEADFPDDLDYNFNQYIGRTKDFERVAASGVFQETPLESADATEAEIRRYCMRAIRHKNRANQSNNECEILNRRYGFYGPPQTLDEIAIEQKVSRERIRQIEARALKHLIDSRFLSSPVVAVHLNWLTFNDNLILPNQKIPSFTATMYSLLNDLFSGKLRITIDRDTNVIYAYPWTTELIAKIAFDFRDDYFMLGFESALKKLLTCIPFQQDSRSLQRLSIRLSNWAMTSTKEISPANRTQLITLALRQIGGPAHFTTIAKFSASIERKHYNKAYANNIHSALCLYQDSFARPGGHGMFGLKSSSIATTLGLRAEIMNVLGKTSRWMTDKEIYQAMPEGSAFNVASISMALSFNLDIFRRSLFFSMWILADGRAPRSNDDLSTSLATYLREAKSATRSECHTHLGEIATRTEIDAEIINNEHIIRVGSARESRFVLYPKKLENRIYTKSGFLQLLLAEMQVPVLKAAMINAKSLYGVITSSEHAIEISHLTKL